MERGKKESVQIKASPLRGKDKAPLTAVCLTGVKTVEGLKTYQIKNPRLFRVDPTLIQNPLSQAQYFQLSADNSPYVIPACPGSFLQRDSRQAGMTNCVVLLMNFLVSADNSCPAYNTNNNINGYNDKQDIPYFSCKNCLPDNSQVRSEIKGKFAIKGEYLYEGCSCC